jgi:hypothetical protein
MHDCGTAIERRLVSVESWYQAWFMDRATAWDRVKVMEQATDYDFYGRLQCWWHLAVLATHPSFERRGKRRLRMFSIHLYDGMVVMQVQALEDGRMAAERRHPRPAPVRPRA